MKIKGIILLVVSVFIGIQASRSQTPEQRLDELGIKLPEVTPPIANYVLWRKVGNLLFLAGHGTQIKGRLGDDLTIEQGYQAARITGIEILAMLKAATGDLNKIKQFVKVHGMVCSAPDFYDQPKVMNGFSDLMVEVFGEKGKHARAAVGQVALPSNIAIEIEVIVEIE